MGPFIFLDIETTGIDPSRDRIIEIACVKWENGKILGKLESLINPRAPIPAEITILTGITDELVKDAPSFSEFKQTVIDFMGDFPVVGHNIAFDMGFLKSHHFQFKNPEIDTLHLAKILLFKETSYALEVLVKKYGAGKRTSHRAMADTLNTLDFFEFLLKKIAKMDEEKMALIKPIFAKTDWPGKLVFNDCVQ